MASLMNTKEISQYIGINEKKIYNLITAKGLPATKVTGGTVNGKRLYELPAALATGQGYAGPVIVAIVPEPGISHAAFLRILSETVFGHRLWIAEGWLIVYENSGRDSVFFTTIQESVVPERPTRGPIHLLQSRKNKASRGKV